MIDSVIAREIELYAENTYEIYHIWLGIVKGIKKAQDKGDYSEGKALIACRRFANTAIKNYHYEFGHFQVNSPTRGAIAQNFLEQALIEAKEQ